jgi:hypothetical protein
MEVEMSKSGLALLMMLAVAIAGCGDEPVLPPFGDGGTSGTDGTDDPDVCDPTTGSDWGETCDKYDPVCPPNTVCQTVEGLGSNYGICTTECCGQNDADLEEHCPDVADGDEICAIDDPVYDTWYCAVECEVSSECPDDQICQNPPSTGISICYPPQAK